jgi:hypothetical protein
MFDYVIYLNQRNESLLVFFLISRSQKLPKKSLPFHKKYNNNLLKMAKKKKWKNWVIYNIQIKENSIFSCFN